jgi:gliding motility-associated-like protein
MIQMKGSFIIVFLLVELIAVLNGFALRAQSGRSQISVKEDNFSTFTRKHANRGKLWIARNITYLRHPDANFDDKCSPNNNAVELFEKRTIDSKFFINKDTPSICYVQKSSSPLHFKKNGQWIAIDARLSPKGKLLYEASNQEHPLGFDLKRKASYIISPEGKTYFNSWKLYGNNGGSKKWLASADWSHYTAGDDGIAIRNIFPGIDAEMKVSRGSIKTNFIVHANKFPGYKKLLFRDTFLGENPGNFTFPNGLGGNGLVSPVDFRLTAQTILHIKEGVMYQKENPSLNYQFIPYYVDLNKLTLSINSEFLNAQLKVGSVVIDPLVQDSFVLAQNEIEGSHLNPNCRLEKSCDYDFDVPGPPAARLIDALFSFGFTANAPCVGQDAGFSFSTDDGCSSQMWVGTSASAGTEYFTNQSILMTNGASITDCFPKPDQGNCDHPQIVHFTFSFFRSCHGPHGCDGSCIGAAEALTITLVGRTFDSASLAASQSNICAGAPVTLKAQGYYGIPPYAFAWPGRPVREGDSVIMVNPSVNTVYQVQIIDACKLAGSTITKSVDVEVGAKLPRPVFMSNSPVCTGGELILSAAYKPGVTYFIQNPDAGLGGGHYDSTAVFKNVTAAYSGTWIAVASSANGCSSDTASTLVVINPAVSPTVNITASATNICPGAKVSFAATVSGGGNSVSYEWLLNGNKVGTNSQLYSDSGFANHDAISCIVSTNGTCVGGSFASNIIVLNVSAVLSPTFAGIGPYCQDTTAPLLPSTSTEGISGTWDPASISTANVGSSTYTFTPTGSQCASTSQIVIVVNPLPGLTMGPGITIVSGTSTLLNVTVTGDIKTYQWTPSIGLSDATIKDPVASPSSTTIYTLDITDDNNCKNNGSIKITVSGGTSKISVPNAFSPNGDGINDIWSITGLSAYPGATVDVFNRYGQLVFHSENNNQAWDGTVNGKPVPVATYYYIIDPKNSEKKIAGSVTIFR